MKKLRKNKLGFTLVELMIVIVIMVILAAAGAPIFSGYMKKARASKHLADCRSIYVAAQTYIEEARAKKNGDVLKLADLDETELQDMVKSLSTYEVVADISDTTTDYTAQGDFTVYVGKSGSEVICSAVVYDGGEDGVWVFNTADGTFIEDVN